MIYHYKHQVNLIILFGFLFAMAFADDNVTMPESSASVKSEKISLRSVQIRVLLDEARDDKPLPSWHLMAKNGFTLQDQTGLQTSHLDSEMIVLNHKNGKWRLNDKGIKANRLLLRANQGSIMVDGISYYGSLCIIIEPHRLLIINCLDLEDYVFCSLAAEGFPGWPLEMNKVQAIAIRTYAAQMIYKNTGKKCLYHIKNTNIHQCYKGKPNSSSLRRAVDETRGIILTYDGKPIIAMYDTCCGGVVPAKMKGIDFKVAPYLARTKACSFCADAKEYRWCVSYLKKDLESILKNIFPRLGKLRSVSVFRKDRAGLVREVEIIGSGGYFYLKGEKIYSIVKGVHSKWFTIEVTPKKIIFNGRGYGHLWGLCQKGAANWIRQGATYREVLLGMYPGTHFMKIKEKAS